MHVLAVLILVTFVWGVSVQMKDVSIVDRIWGFLFVVQAWTLFIATDVSRHWTQWVFLACISIWGLRLTWYIQSRNKGHGEDKRYQVMRAKRPEIFWIYSYPMIFLFQAGISLVVGLPIWHFFKYNHEPSVIVVVLASVVWFIGFYFEAMGDHQLTVFKANPANKGKIMDQGLWALTRHPNYFGDALMWWGIGLFCLGTDQIWWAFLGPLTMTLVIRYFSGVTLLDAQMSKERPGYKEYMEKTPAFIPRLWPKK